MNEDIGRLKSKVLELEARVAFLENQLSVSVDLIARSPSDPESSIVKCRVLLERVVKDLYVKLDVPLPGKAHELGALLNNSQFTRLLPPRVVLRMNSVREYGNLGAHDKGPVTMSDALDCLNCMVEIADWYRAEHAEVETGKGTAAAATSGTRARPAAMRAAASGSRRTFAWASAGTVGLAVAVWLWLRVVPWLAQNPAGPAGANPARPGAAPVSVTLQIDGVGPDVRAALSLAYAAERPESAPSAAIAVMARTGDGGAWRPLEDGASLSSADDYRVLFESSEPAYFYVFQIDSAGKVDWLFPVNRASPFSSGTNPAVPKLWTQLPSEHTAFHLDETGGTEHIYVIATRSSWPELESRLAAAVASNAHAAPVPKPLNLRTRGVGGIRVSTAAFPLDAENQSPDVFTIMEGKSGVLAYEKWFQHVPRAPTQ